VPELKPASTQIEQRNIQIEQEPLKLIKKQNFCYQTIKMSNSCVEKANFFCPQWLTGGVCEHQVQEGA